MSARERRSSTNQQSVPRRMPNKVQGRKVGSVIQVRVGVGYGQVEGAVVWQGAAQYAGGSGMYGQVVGSSASARSGEACAVRGGMVETLVRGRNGEMQQGAEPLTWVQR